MKLLLSLDVFDTAIFRDVYDPKDIFTVVENKIGNNFAEIRSRAQEVCGKKNIYYNLIDIYNRMPRKFNPKEEIIAEIENCRANPYILDIYNSGEYDCIFISDMYLPSEVIIKMLEKCGYKNPKVFVSCEEKALKATGEIFSKVGKKLGRGIYKHIGDNYGADIRGAKKAGIKETEYIGPPIYKKETKVPVLKDPRLRKLFIENELSNKSIERKIGYIFGPLILSFLETVLNEASFNQTLFFNARDSFILYLIARYILKTDKRIKYCRFSRKSAHLPNIDTKVSFNHAVNTRCLGFFKTSRVRNLRELIKEYGLDENFNYNKGLEKSGITIDTRIDLLPNRAKLIEDFMIVAQKQFYEKVASAKANFLRYISNLGMKDNDLFIDLGHFGSMQSIIKKIAGISLKGRYIHMYEFAGDRYGVTVEKTSFLPKGCIGTYTGVVELIFSEPHGTSVYYDDRGVPICDKDIKYRKDVTKELLRGVIDCVRDMKERNISPVYSDCIKIMMNFLEYPTIEEAEFANREIFENGSAENNESVVWFDREWIRKGKLKECYNRSYWKPAFKALLENDPYLSFLRKEL